MNRSTFIVAGTILLAAGLVGIAAVETNFYPFESKTASRLEVPPDTSSQQAGQSRIDGKLPPQVDKGAAGAPQSNQLAQSSPGAGPSPSNPPSQVVTPGTSSQKPADTTDQFADIVPKAPENTQRAQSSPSSGIPPVLTGERRIPQQAAQQKDLAKPSSPGKSTSAKTRTSIQREGARYTEYTAGSRSTSQSTHPVAMRFSFDPARSRDVKLAWVHLGDRVVIRVRRIGPAERQIYIGFDMPGGYRDPYYPRYSPVSRAPNSVITTVSDNDSITLRGASLFGPALSRKLDSKSGAVLKLGARQHPSGRVRPGYYARSDGYYEIDVTIYPGNKWNIRPRSLL